MLVGGVLLLSPECEFTQPSVGGAAVASSVLLRFPVNMPAFGVCPGGRNTVWGVQHPGSGSGHVHCINSLILFCV